MEGMYNNQNNLSLHGGGGGNGVNHQQSIANGAPSIPPPLLKPNPPLNALSSSNNNQEMADMDMLSMTKEKYDMLSPTDQSAVSNYMQQQRQAQAIKASQQTSLGLGYPNQPNQQHSFPQVLTAFHAGRGTVYTPGEVEGRAIDMQRLYTWVAQAGGYNKVHEIQGGWKAITSKLGFVISDEQDQFDPRVQAIIQVSSSLASTLDIS
jgi:hypothetical protein